MRFRLQGPRIQGLIDIGGAVIKAAVRDGCFRA